MKLNFIKKVLLVSAFTLAIASCTTDDNIGKSQLIPSNPTVSVDLGFTDPVVLIEDDSVYEFTVNLSETQIVDTRLYLTQVGGTANADDYEMPNYVVIPAGYTSGIASIKIIADELVEDVETLTIQIGDNQTVNSSMTPVNVNFTISNATADDLVIGLSWAASEYATNDMGEEIDATDMADMRLLVTNSPYTGIYGGSDGAGFETYEMLGANYADGEYLIVADFWDQFTAPVVRDMDLQVTFDQIGTINGLTYDFPAAINNGQTCSANYFVLAKVIKTGSMYDITPVGQDNSLNVEGTWNFDLNDSWGDGWNGGYLTVTINGTSTNYAALSANTNFDLEVPAGATFKITYTSGGGTGGSPGWESENTYTITAPDGTTYSDGPVPAEGTVLDSQNICP